MASNDQDAFPPDYSDEEELTPFDVRDSSGRSGLLKLFLGLGFLLAIALIVLKVYQPGVRDRNSPPKIHAEKTPFKIEPEDAGGVQTPDQDKAVYDVMNGKAPEETVNPKPIPEDPSSLPGKANIQLEPATVITGTIEKPAKTPETKPVIDKPVVIPPVAKTPTGGSNFVVQVASVRSQSAANDIWTMVSADNSDIIGTGLYADIKRADLEERGIYYRLRVAGLADKAAADRLCDQFKARQQSCFVTRK